jgi:glycosyltransferase involved in cell wall biosynthesis
MRIALVTPGFSASDEDWCIPALQDLACQLGERHPIHVFSTTYPHRVDNYRVKGIPVSSFGDGRPGRLALMRRMRKTAAAIEAANRIEPFDVLHGFWTNHGAIVTAWVAWRLSIPNIVTAMAGELTYEPAIGYGGRNRPIAGRLARFGAVQADELTVLSGFHAGRLKLELPALKPRIVPFGIDTTRFSSGGPVRSLDGQIAVLSVGSLVPAKGHAVVLKAFAAASSRLNGLHLHLLGIGVLESALRHQVEEFGISRSVTFHGHVEHDLLPAYYRGASFCVLGSHFESQGMVILEAAACGRATIGSAVGSMPSFCPEQFLCHPGNDDELAAMIVKVAGSPQLAERLGEDAEEVVRARYLIEHTVAELEILYGTMTR